MPWVLNRQLTEAVTNRARLAPPVRLSVSWLCWLKGYKCKALISGRATSEPPPGHARSPRVSNRFCHRAKRVLSALPPPRPPPPDPVNSSSGCPYLLARCRSASSLTCLRTLISNVSGKFWERVEVNLKDTYIAGMVAVGVYFYWPNAFPELLRYSGGENYRFSRALWQWIMRTYRAPTAVRSIFVELSGAPRHMPILCVMDTALLDLTRADTIFP